MTTKEYLSQISKFDNIIENKMTELTQLKKLSCELSAIPNEEKVQSTPNYDKIGTLFCKIEAMEENINRLTSEYLDKKNEIISQIDNIEEKSHYKVLFSRYINGNSFKKIAVEMKYSWRNIMRLHIKALQEFEKKYGDLYLKK